MKPSIPVVTLFMLPTLCLAQLPANFQTLVATEKQELLWNRILESRYKSLPTADLEAMLSSMLSAVTGDASQGSLWATLTTASDELPSKKNGKFIHPPLETSEQFLLSLYILVAWIFSVKKIPHDSVETFQTPFRRIFGGVSLKKSFQRDSISIQKTRAIGVMWPFFISLRG